MFRSLHSVMFIVPDVAEAVRWYSRLLQINPVYVLPDFPVLTVDNVEICFHRADEKGAPALGGAVTYWRVDDWQRARGRIEQMGGSLHRGPLSIEGDQQIGQFRDPFGNVFGIVAPAQTAGH
jgi:predicted enzyme related to lactoylglutathione lyase